MDGAHKRKYRTENTTKPENTTENTTESENTTENTTEPEDTTELEDTIEPENTTENTTEPEKEIISQTPEKNLMYYFNRFRYYHYVVAEKVETAIGVLCLMIIKVYFFLTGQQQFALEPDGSLNTMNMDMIDDDDY
ncbi:uncharacterized protein LOC143364111 isoform X2 [Halictus rubicundus]|uniref:uncharacterized protein LOC143364111 isoform X2 n=1 Tax=Halictus rubicundus TaxID=77578 RepID=UPI0040371B2E